MNVRKAPIHKEFKDFIEFKEVKAECLDRRTL